MNDKEVKLNSERIINVSNFYDIKLNMSTFNETNPYMKSMNNSISSQKLRTQNSTCSSYLKSNKTFSNEENIISGIKSKKNEINETLLKNLCLSKFSDNNAQTVSNLKKIIYKKKQVNGVCKIKGNKIAFIKNINALKNKKEKNVKKINLINEEFSKKINNKQKKEFNDLTLDEYLKEQIKHIKIKNNTSYFNNDNNDITNKENENIQQITIINNQNKNQNDIPNKRNYKNNEKTFLNHYITYNTYKFESHKNKNQKNKISTTQINNSKKTYIELPKPKKIFKNRLNSSTNKTGKIVKINLNKNNISFLDHKKHKSFDGFYNGTISQRINLNDSKLHKPKIINLKIGLKDLKNINKENTHKRTFRFSKSSKRINNNININNFTKDFFILPKLKKF